MGPEIYVVTGSGQGHLHPCMELCNHLSSHNYQPTLLVPSPLYSSVPSSFSHKTFPIAYSGRPMPTSDPLQHQALQDLQAHLADRPLPACAIIDFQMSWTKAAFSKFNIPFVGFFTFGACAAAMEWAAWKLQAGDMKPGETRFIPGLPEQMALTHHDLKRKRFGDSMGGRGPPLPGSMPPWVTAIEGSVALMFNTCRDLEGPFLKYIADQIGMPAFGVGPLLPEQYWKSPVGGLISDSESRAQKRRSNVAEDEVIQWLESKALGSVLYVAFGSEVGPTMEEYSELAKALEEWSGPFIWAIQEASGYIPEGLESKVGKRGMVIYGWAPQLLILSHPSTGGFLSHCGWNSTAEAIGRGVKFLAWPVRGDQHFNAKLVVNYLEVGCKVAEDLSEVVKKEDLIKGMEKVMGDGEMERRAAVFRGRFCGGFPQSAQAALDAFKHFMT